MEAGSDAVETSGLKESCGEDGVWNHLTEYLKIAQGRLLVKGQPSRNTDTRILESQDHGMSNKDSNSLKWSWPEPRRQAMCPLDGWALEEPDDCE